MQFALNLFPSDIIKLIYHYCVRDNDMLPTFFGLLTWAMILRCSNRITYLVTRDNICSGFDLVRNDIKKPAFVISHIPYVFEKKTLVLPRHNLVPEEIPELSISLSKSHNDDNDDIVKCSTQRFLFFDKEERSLKARKKSKSIVPSDNFRKSDQKNTHRMHKKTQRTRRLAVQKDRFDHDAEEYIKTIPITPFDEWELICYVCLDSGCPFCGREPFGPYSDSD
jgi:hypothetical protein